MQLPIELRAGAREWTRRHPLLVAGLFLWAAFGIPGAFRLVTEVPPTRVLGCEVYYSHGPRAKVTTSGGRHFDFGISEMAFPERCIEIGQRLEKKRWEWPYRVGDRDLPVGSPDPFVKVVAVLLGALGVLWDGASTLLRCRRERQ
jgi:hypothetical protein